MLHRYVLLCASILAFLFSAPVASAQCTRATNGFMNIGVVPNNPFMPSWRPPTKAVCLFSHQALHCRSLN